MPTLTSRPFPFHAGTTLQDLKTAGLLVVSCLRLWARAYADPYGSHPSWIVGLRAAGLDKAANKSFDAFMRIIAVSATRSLDLRAPAGVHIAQDEALLL